MVLDTTLNDLSIARRLLPPNMDEREPDNSVFFENLSKEYETKHHHLIPEGKPLFPAEGLSHRDLPSSNTWTESSMELPREFSEISDRSDRTIFVQKYNELAKKYEVRSMFSCTYKSSTENLRASSARHESWFLRRILRRISSTRSISAKHNRFVRQKRSFSEITSRIKTRRDKLKGKSLQELSRLCGVSSLYLPAEYTPGALLMPTCFRAMGQYLIENGTSARGLFRIPGSHNTVNDLYNYYCYSNEQSETVAGTIRSPILPDHIKYDVYDVASAFKKLLIGLPGGILGSLKLFDAFVSIKTQLSGGPEPMRMKLSRVRARLIALAILTLSSEYRRALICAVFGLLCMIGRVAENTKEEDQCRPLPTSDLMDYSSLGIIFGPVLTGDLLENYSMRLANPKEGLMLLPITPPKSRKERKSRTAKTHDESKTIVSQMDKIEVANDITEMLITQWREVVRHLKIFSSQNLEENILRSGTSNTKNHTLQPQGSGGISCKSKSDLAKRSKRNTYPSITIGLPPSEGHEGCNVAMTKQNLIPKSFSIQEIPAHESSSMPSSKFVEMPSHKVCNYTTQFGPRKLQESTSSNFLSHSYNQGIPDGHQFHCPERSTTLANFDKGCESYNLDMFLSSSTIDKKYVKKSMPSKYVFESLKTHTRSDDVLRKSKSFVHLPVPTKERLKKSKILSTKFSLWERRSKNQENSAKKGLSKSSHRDSKIYPHTFSRKFIENNPRHIHHSLEDEPNLEISPKKCDSQLTSCLMNEHKNHESSPSRTSISPLNNSLASTSQEVISLTKNFIKATEARLPDDLNASAQARYSSDNNFNPNTYSSPNWEKKVSHSVEYINQIDESPITSGSVSGTSHRSNKISDLLAKFENNIQASALSKKNDTSRKSSNSVQSRDKLLATNAKNMSAPTKPITPTQSDIELKRFQGIISNSISPILDSEISHIKAIRLGREKYEIISQKKVIQRSNKPKSITNSMSDFSDQLQIPLRKVKSSVEIPTIDVPKPLIGSSRPNSIASQFDGQNSNCLNISNFLPSIDTVNKSDKGLQQHLMSKQTSLGELQPNLSKILTKSSSLLNLRQESIINQDQTEWLANLSRRQSKSHDEISCPKNMNPNFKFAPGRSNPLLYDQVRNLQRQLDKEREEIQKLKQQLGTRQDITIGSLNQKLQDSKRLVHYWQERAEGYEEGFNSLNKFLSEYLLLQDSQGTISFSSKKGTSRQDSNSGEPKVADLIRRSFVPSSLTEVWETTGWNSECSTGTVIGECRQPASGIEYNMWLKQITN